MDTVSVKDVSVAAVIGVHAWEREIEQTLLVSVDMTADVRTAAATDDLADALDYSAVAAAIAAVLREGKFRLIETAAERIAERLLADFRLSWLRLELRKPIAAGGYTAIITIERAREIPDCHEKDALVGDTVSPSGARIRVCIRALRGGGCRRCRVLLAGCR
jgi:dihydroneopterin aldolase